MLPGPKPEVLAEFQAMVKANTQMQLAAILANDTPILLRINSGCAG
jgi:hypothetical protein